MVTKARRFLGLARYYRRFVEGFSKLSLPWPASLGRIMSFLKLRRAKRAFKSSKGVSKLPQCWRFPREPRDLCLIVTLRSKGWVLCFTTWEGSSLHIERTQWLLDPLPYSWPQACPSCVLLKYSNHYPYVIHGDCYLNHKSLRLQWERKPTLFLSFKDETFVRG